MRYAAGLAVVVALAGCGGTSGGGGGPSSTRSVRSTASPTPSSVQSTSVAIDPVLARIPAAARPETMKGAEAYARYFISRVNRAWSAPDAGAMNGLFAPDCKTCAAFADSAKRMALEGRRHDGDTLTVRTVSAISFADPVREVRVDLTQNSVPVLDTEGGRVGTTRPGAGSFVLTMRFEGHWVVTRLQAVKA